MVGKLDHRLALPNPLLFGLSGRRLSGSRLAVCPSYLQLLDFFLEVRQKFYCQSDIAFRFRVRPRGEDPVLNFQYPQGGVLGQDLSAFCQGCLFLFAAHGFHHTGGFQLPEGGINGLLSDTGQADNIAEGPLAAAQADGI